MQLTQESETGRGILDESQEIELSAALLEVVNHEQLDCLLRRVVEEADVVIGALLAPSVKQALVDLLTHVLGQITSATNRRTVTITGASLGKRIGAALAALAGQVLGIELEGLSPEDREFEAGKQFIRFGAETARNAIEGASGTSPADLAHAAAVEAAQIFAPGLALARSAPLADDHASFSKTSTCNSVQRYGTGEEHMHNLWEPWPIWPTRFPTKR